MVKKDKRPKPDTGEDEDPAEAQFWRDMNATRDGILAGKEPEEFPDHLRDMAFDQFWVHTGLKGKVSYTDYHDKVRKRQGGNYRGGAGHIMTDRKGEPMHSFEFDVPLLDYKVGKGVVKQMHKFREEVLDSVKPDKLLADLTRLDPRLTKGLRPGAVQDPDQLKKIATNLQKRYDNGTPVDELLHRAKLAMALTDEPFRQKVTSSNPVEAVEALHELYTDRIKDYHTELLSDPKRLKRIREQHAKELGVPLSDLPEDFEDLRELYGFTYKTKERGRDVIKERDNPLEALTVLEKQLPDSGFARAKAELERRGLVPKTVNRTITTKDGKKKTIKAKEVPKEWTDLHKEWKARFSDMRSRFVGENAAENKDVRRAKKIVGSVRTEGAGSTARVMVDFKPSIRDAFAGEISSDCTRGRDFFAGQEFAFNGKLHHVLAGAKDHFGNVYVLVGEMTQPDGSKVPVLHIDALQPHGTKADNKALVKGIVDRMAEHADPRFRHITCNSDAYRTSNFSTTQSAFKDLYFGRSPSVDVDFPSKLRSQGFHSTSGTGHLHIATVHRRR